MTPTYGTHHLGGLPSAVTIHEVGLRDGLQNEPTPVPTDVKAAMAERLVAAGLREVEATSFVRPDRVPQLADAEELLGRLPSDPDVRYWVLVPNQRGLERALAAGARQVAVFASVTESFSQRNLGCSIAEAHRRFAPVVADATAAGVPVRGYLSMCFGDPWEGAVPVDATGDAARRLLDLGCYQISLGDTIGVATPGHVRAVVERLAERGVPPAVVALHLHDTYGQALANTLAGLQAGVTVFDASAGGLGGCPFAGAATGNLATEDLVWMLHGLGIETGIDLDALVAASVWLAGRLGRPSPSRVVTALAGRGR
jgi:hydroxymethylglutaryl-CoA lyase